jgi:hypothetical protein
VTAEAPDEISPGQGARTDIADELRSIRTKLKQGTSVDYLATRLKRDFPDIAAAVGRGEFKSIRQAAIAAGIVKPPGVQPTSSMRPTHVRNS